MRLENTIKSSEVESQDYNLVKHDRNRNGGVVAICIRNVIPFSERKSLIPENVEAICLKNKKPKSKPIIISTWYRLPGSNNTGILDCFETFLQNIDENNIDLLCKHNKCSNTRWFNELLNTYQLLQLINKLIRMCQLKCTSKMLAPMKCNQLRV